MRGRPRNPQSEYKMRPHLDNGHIYAATLSNGVSQKTGKSYRKYTHWGKLTEGKVFVPNLEFVMLPLEKQGQFIFPDDWDVSRVKKVRSIAEEQMESGKLESEHPSSNSKADNLSEKYDESIYCLRNTENQFNNRLYGCVWFLLQIAYKIKLIEDLNIVFEYNEQAVNDILTLAIFPYITQRNFDRCSKWQEYTKTPSINSLTPSYITRFTQHIKDRHRMEFIKLRVERQPKDSYLSCDTTTRSAWGECLADIHWGNNKDNVELQNTVEAVVYSLTTHEPVYYRTFPGNMLDLRTLRTIKSDLIAVGAKNITFIFDRGFESSDNFCELFISKTPFIMFTKVSNDPVKKFIESISFDSDGMPADMIFDNESKLYCQKYKIENQYFINSEGEKELVNNFFCNLYLNMVNRILKIQKIKCNVSNEKQLIENALYKRDRKELIDLSKKLQYHKILLNNNTEEKLINCDEIKIIENKNTIDREKKFAGFFSSIIYNKDYTAIESLNIYKTRDEQEKYFEQMKCQMDFHTQDCSSEDGKTGRLFILFIGLILSTVVRSTWKKSTKLKKLYRSSYAILDEMAPIRFCEYPDGSTHITSFLSNQVEICKEFGLKPPKDCLSSTERKNDKASAATRKRGRPRKSDPSSSLQG